MISLKPPEITLIENYEASTSIHGTKYYPISVNLPWRDENPILREKLDHEVILSVFHKIKSKDLFNFILLTDESPYQNSNYSNIKCCNFSNGIHQTLSIDLNPTPYPILNVRPLSVYGPNLDSYAIDIKNHYIHEISKAIDMFFMESFINELGNNIYTELGYIRDSNKLCSAILNVICKITDINYTEKINIISSPTTIHELKILISGNYYQGYQWLNNFNLIEIDNVPQEYLYIVPQKRDNYLGYLIGVKNLLVVNKKGNTCIECDKGIIDQSIFGRIKVKSSN